MHTADDLERITALAHQIWVQEGRPSGRDREHWAQAEKELESDMSFGVPEPTGDEDPDVFLSSSDSERAVAEREPGPHETLPKEITLPRTGAASKTRR